jgi:hypothetical protein
MCARAVSVSEHKVSVRTSDLFNSSQELGGLQPLSF